MKPLFFFVFLALHTLPAVAQKINTEPIDAYWKMVEPLKRGDTLSKANWKSFLAMEANEIYVQNQGFSADYLESLRKNIQYVYMPQWDTLLQRRLKAIAKDPSAYWLTYKVYVYKQHEAALKAYVEEVKKPAYLDSLYANTFQWLPKRLQHRDSSVTLYLLGIENDAIAGGGVIIATAWSFYNQDKVKWACVAGHEMHHVLRGSPEIAGLAKADSGIMYFLSRVLNEGSADMIDKPVILAREAELPMEFQYRDFELFQADSILRQVDTALQLLAAGKVPKIYTEKDYRNLVRWTSGHCPGYYMANVIVQNGGKKALLQDIQNPFAFFYRYNTAGKRDKRKPPVFSPAAVAYVKQLEKKYGRGK